ncbi:FG-GAP-like repeat-containing protein [Sorangium sp. So ce726]|uniref:FG-GAP-like repeat-containing protein n=1 Tax=Sorangium sp. So ce726 TaxID=3133319 RepID=UPI003F63D2C2
MKARRRDGHLFSMSLSIAVIISVSGCGTILGLDEFSDADRSSTGTGGGAMQGSGGSGGGAGTFEAPTTPVLRLPLNDAYVGTMRKNGSRRPTFVWEASTVAGDVPIEYELQYSSDPAMTHAVSVVTEEVVHRPEADLDGALLPPAGQRYYWRVRACSQRRCSDFSPARWINVGRTKCDFNADGFDDVAVGAVGLTTTAGAAYFYYGAAESQFGGQPSGVVFSPDGAGDGFGASLACAGDVDGDGYADVVVGAPRGESGKAIVYRGSGRDTFRGEIIATLPDAGIYLASAGDVNADGFGDVIVSREDPPSGYLYFGGPSGIENLSNPVILEVDVDAGTQLSGVIVSAAGDVNGDEFSDVILAVAAHGLRVIRLYFGHPGQGFDVSPAVELEAPPDDPEFFSSIAAAGDVNGDGFGDVIVGSSAADRAYVYWGGPEGIASTPDVTLVGVSRTGFGNAVASAGDMNMDGFDEVAVGSSDAASRPGVVYVYEGGPGAAFDGVPDVAMYRPGDTQRGFGSVLGSSGDVNGDGYADLTAGAPFASIAYIYFGKSDLVATAEADASVSQPHDSSRPFGVAVTKW